MIKINKLHDILIRKKKEFYIYIILFISSFNILLNFFKKNIYENFSVFGDFLVYRCAGVNFINGESPYGVNQLQNCLNSYPNSLDFFYPPITLSFFSFFGHLNLELSLWIWGILIIISLVSIICFTYKFFSNNNSFFIFLLIFLFSFGGLNWTGIQTGNISIIIYGLISLALYCLINGRNNYFYALIVFCAIIKPTYIIFILLPILLNPLNLKEFKKIIVSVIISFLIYALSYLNNPYLFGEFLNHLEYAKSPEFKEIFGQGFGLFSIINSFISSTVKSFGFEINTNLVSNLIWLSIISLFLFYSLLQKEKIEDRKINRNIALGVCAITLCYPLLKHYECFIVIPCLFFIINNLKTRIKYVLLILMFGLHDKYSLLLVLTFTFAYETYFINKKILK